MSGRIDWQRLRTRRPASLPRDGMWLFRAVLLVLAILAATALLIPAARRIGPWS